MKKNQNIVLNLLYLLINYMKKNQIILILCHLHILNLKKILIEVYYFLIEGIKY